MSNYRIIYKNKDGGTSVVIPTPNWLKAANNNYTLLAKKTVPANRPWKIINVNDLPADRELRTAWRYPDEGRKVKPCPDCYKKALERLKWDTLRRVPGDKKTAKKGLEAILEGVSNINDLKQLKQIENKLRQFK